MSLTKTIAIDGRFWGDAGPGRYVKDIVEHLEKIDHKHTYYIFLRSKGFEEFIPTSPNFIKILADVPWYSFKEQFIFLFQVLKCNADIFYVPHFNIPVLYPFKLVTAIPDIIMHTYSTEKGTTLPKYYFKFKKFIYKNVLLWAILRSYKVIVPTKDVRNDMVKVYPFLPDSKFLIAPEGVDPDFIEMASKLNSAGIESKNLLEEFKIKSPFLLYISSMYEHKNAVGLVNAFKILLEKFNFPGSLVLVGKKDKFSERVGDYIKNLKLEDRIILPGLSRYITDKETVLFRKSAKLYVFPSFKEGFSLTPLEAQSVGLACVISDISCHREVFENSVEYFDPSNPQDMAEKIYKVFSNGDIQNELIKKGYENIKKYNWDQTASLTLGVFNDILKDT